MRSSLRLLLITGFLALPGLAQAETTGPGRPTTVDGLITAFQAKMDELRAGLNEARKAKDAKRYAALIEDFARTPGDYVPHIRTAVEAAKGSGAEGRGLAWLFRKAKKPGERDELLARLLANFGRSAAMAEVCKGLRYSRREDADAILEDQLANNPQRAVKGHACFTLAARLQERPAPSADSRKRIEALLRRVIDEYADLPHFSRGSLGVAAEQALFALLRLAIGSVAPEIEGRDLDGVAFKLSDYRGKVVLLDFWGHW